MWVIESTSSGKLSVKPMPKGRHHEIYQDYVCGCVLRTAREVFALIPVDIVLVTALADAQNESDGQVVEDPILSVAMPRTVIAGLNFVNLDPSGTMAIFQHRGDFKGSRNSTRFQLITPLKPEDITHRSVEGMDFRELLLHTKQMRSELQVEICKLSFDSDLTIP